MSKSWYRGKVDGGPMVEGETHSVVSLSDNVLDAMVESWKVRDDIAILNLKNPGYRYFAILDTRHHALVIRREHI